MPLFLLGLLACGEASDSASKDADGDGWSVEDGDCDDDNASVYPVANEVWYDNLDQNCDGNDDDQDLDGHSLPDGDCDDTMSAVHPGATEICDDLDNDCNGLIDDDAVDESQGWTDADGDGYGDKDLPVVVCGALDEGVVENNTDCDDVDPAVNPGASEVCDEVDNDCDGFLNEAEGAPPVWYRDGDGDGHGDPVLGTAACEAPEGYVSAGDDCDDTDPEISPSAEEDCAAGDLNCDGDEQAGAWDAVDYYEDLDGDGYGGTDSLLSACSDPGGRTTIGGDCDDADAGTSPAEVEVCDGSDNDCDGTADVDAIDATPWYTDDDGDGFGTTLAAEACDGPSGTAALDDDCDDTDDEVYPGAAELCDGIDGNCDGAVDDVTASGTSYTDADGDGYGDPDTEATWTCVAPTDGVENGDDCDDGDAATSPGADELCNGVDDDCDDDVDEDGAADGSTFYADADGDGFGDAAEPVVACAQPDDHVTDSDDCDDGDAAIRPGATEACDSADNDCDGNTDEAGATGERTWYPDDDSDGFGDDASATVACTGPSGAIEDGGDCDDLDPDVNPDADEVCDHIDNNCIDGTEDESGAGWVDASGNFTDVTTTLAAGKSSAPVSIGDVSSYSLYVDEGTVHLCDGTWYAKFVTSSATTRFEVVGSGADRTTISSGGAISGTAGSIVSVSSSTIDLSDLTITGGLGSSSGKGGGVVVAQATAKASEPNVTMTRVVVEGNSATYGGAIALNTYGWVSMVDSVLMDNTASSYGGGVYVTDSGTVTCSASTKGASGIVANTAPSGAGIYFASSTAGELDSTGCDFGATGGAEDNSSADIAVGSTKTYCYGDASSVSTVIDCSGGTCTASSETCP